MIIDYYKYSIHASHVRIIIHIFSLKLNNFVNKFYAFLLFLTLLLLLKFRIMPFFRQMSKTR